MSRSRHGTPLSAYSDSPLVRNNVRLIVTSENSMGSNPAELSITSSTSARPSAGRAPLPAKMTSSILAPRSVRGPWAPRTQATASTRFDLPDPLGPTTTVTPGSNSSVVFSANDLNPRIVSDFKNTRAGSVLSCASYPVAGSYRRPPPVPRHWFGGVRGDGAAVGARCSVAADRGVERVGVARKEGATAGSLTSSNAGTHTSHHARPDRRTRGEALDEEELRRRDAVPFDRLSRIAGVEVG